MMVWKTKKRCSGADALRILTDNNHFREFAHHLLTLNLTLM